MGNISHSMRSISGSSVNYEGYGEETLQTHKGFINPFLNIKIMATKKYYKTLSEAKKACAERNKGKSVEWYQVFKMSKGTRHHGEYAVCSYMEWLNTD